MQWAGHIKLAQLGIALILTAIPFGAFASAQQTRLQQENRALAWAEMLVHYTLALPSRQHEYSNLSAIFNAKRVFSEIEGKFGPSTRSRIGQGQLLFAEGNFTAAEKCFQQALKFSPGNVKARRELSTLHAYRRILGSLKPLLPHKYSVIAMAPISVQKQVFWAVTYYATRPGTNYEDTTLAVFNQTGGRWHRVNLLPENVHTDGYRIFAHDITGDKQPELITVSLHFDSGGSRDHVQVFTWRHRQFVRIYNPDDRLFSWFEDLNHDGKYEIGSSIEIGNAMCHGEQPRWLDIYAYKNGRYILADNHFSREYKGWPAQLKQVLHKYNDDIIWHYLGKAYETQGQHKAAARAYRRAKKLGFS